MNLLQNNALAALTHLAPKGVVSAIQEASTSTGVDFAYLVQQAKAESSFNATAEAKTSSAAGLFQFIESTWMGMVDKYGDKFGLETDGKSKDEILEMRKDPEIASFMAAAFASENESFLEANWARGEKEIGSTELYFAHFLGARQAAAFLNARDENGQKEAALLFPKAAKANYNVFYDSASGRAKTLDEVYAYFDKKFEIEEIVTADLAVDQVEDSYQMPGDDYPEDGLSSYKIERAGGAQNALFSQYSRFSARSAPSSYDALMSYQSLIHSPIELMLLAQMELPSLLGKDDKMSNLF